ncbi:MAG TPA: hypothetical protein VF490_19035 [Chryseosolibacter sp.]
MTLRPMRYVKNAGPLFILPVLGVSFWFAIAFPFGDRNESYLWIASLQESSFTEIVQHPIPSIRTFRPLAQGLTWCLYHLSGENGILTQVTNFVLLCVAIWMMIPLLEVSKRPYMRLLYLVIGFVYFSAFYYIFNLHGVFYSPMLVLIVFFLKAQDGVLRNWKWWLLACFILAFFHPLILVCFVAYVSGWLIEKRHVDMDKIILLGFILVILLILLNMFLPVPIQSVINVQNIVGTTRNVENHVVTKIFTLLFCFLAMLSGPRNQRVLLGGMIAAYLVAAAIYDLPFLLLLGFLILLTLVMEKRWSLAALVAAVIAFPLAVGSGAPTKASIFIFLLPYLLLRSLPLPVMNEWVPRVTGIAGLAVITFCAMMVRMEINVPMLSPTISPVLVEKGKSYQLESALALAGRENPPRRIRFLQEKPGNIRDYGQPRERDNFPPTKQGELDVYQRYLFSGHVWKSLPVWYLAFGSPLERDTLRVIDTLREENCKPAYLYAPRFSP